FFGGPAFREAARAQDKSSDRLVKAKEGGKVESPSGKAWLVIPAGALQTDTRISIREIPSEDILYSGPSFELKPDGLKFLKPAMLTVRFSAKDIAEGYSAEDLAFSEEEAAPQESAPSSAGAPGTGGQASPTGGLIFLDTTANVSAGTVSAPVAHLSKYILWAASSYKLGAEQQFIQGTKKFFNIILPNRSLQGKATIATGKCNTQGEFFVNVSVPLGQEGTAFGGAAGTKFFRVKPSSKGLKEVTSVVEVEFGHNADISKETNSYIMQYGFILGAWLPGNWMWSLTGQPKYSPIRVRYGREKPEVHHAGHKYPGTMAIEGLFEQVFFLHPLMKGEDFPMGPEYPKPESPQFAEHFGRVQKHNVAFQNCRLVAGRVYGLVIDFITTVSGGLDPAMGGDVIWHASILGMTIKAQQ
ncbi:MAG TPA: hypothetical protein VGB72_07815, partial [Acidobacteriota bacterium]